MSRLSAWLKKYLRIESSPKPPSPDEPPFLPPSRRPITPTSIDTPACLFFQLPYDIRSIILSMAFDRRMLHMDLVQQAGAWQWRGLPCGRNHPAWKPSMRWHWIGPWNDACITQLEMDRYRSRDPNDPAVRSGVYDIGAMGFLLSCRQAYMEGVDVLYAANCISIYSEPLLLHLPRLIPHNRLASITSLELTVQAHRIEKDDGTVYFNMDHLKPILDNIVKYCPNLRKFYLSLLVYWDRRGHDLLTGPALPLLDAFWRSKQLRNMIVELPEPHFRALKTARPITQHPREAPCSGPGKRSDWRALDSKEPQVQYRSLERYPSPPLKLPVGDGGEDEVESAGYWLREGHGGFEHLISNCGAH
ncbi:hypothetical protein J4E93_008104 [Alternaria ventricosa]|uniref:uncharacterized protein n=1 Tax=Alternaria ventricosa TaxID=1187951 RepID=UPI0020C273FF|nr:uncharacterized protein J4E93_008104 [Alternaria ventricosa]KAI4641225.1 hypothetical protein J4E93_008104 [Alternaria ventricosa]